MDIAEKVIRAKNDFDDVYEAGKQKMVDLHPEVTASGNYISVDDVSELPHSVACKVASVNLLNPNALGGGELVEFNDVSCYKFNDRGANYVTALVIRNQFKPNTQYTFTGRFYRDGLTSLVQLDVVYTDGTTSRKQFSLGNIVSFTTTSEKTVDYICAAYYDGRNAYLDLSVSCLHEGATALPYTPYVDNPETVQVTRCGRNLLNPNNLGGGEIVEYNGAPCYKYRDNATNFKYYGSFLPNTQYTFSFKAYAEDGKTDLSFGCLLYYVDGSYDRILAFHNREYTIVTAANKTVSYITGVYSNNRVIYIDLEYTRLSLGATALPYEPYNGQTLTPKADGTVEGMTSVSPYMNIFTDNAGAMIEATYRISWGMQEERERFYNDFAKGKINTSIDFAWLLLTNLGFYGVINALSDTATGQTLTLSIIDVDDAFATSSGAADGSTSTEFAALVATKPNWTIILK